MWSDQLTNFIEKLSNPPDDISKFITEQYSSIEFKGYGTPELEIKFLHQLFIQIQRNHPEFETFSWGQCNSYNDNYHHFQLTTFIVNDKHSVESSINFFFSHNKSDEMNSDIYFDSVEYLDPEEIEFAKANNFEFDKEGLTENYWNDFWEFRKNKYKHLEIPCLKFLVILKLLEIHFSMYFFLYTFGNAVIIKFDKEGVTITKTDINELEGSPLGEGMGLDDL